MGHLEPQPSRHCSRAHILPPSGSERSALASCTMDPMARTSGEVWGKLPLEMCLKWSKRGCVDGASLNTFVWTLAGNRKQTRTFNSLLWPASIMAFQNQGSWIRRWEAIISMRKRYELFGPGGPTFGDLVVPSQFPSCKVCRFTIGQGTSWKEHLAPEKRRPFPTKSQLSFNIFHPFSIFSCHVRFERVFNLIAMLVTSWTQLCGLWGHRNGKVTACHHSLRGCRTFHTRKGAGGQQWQNRWHQQPVIFGCWWLLNGTICITLASRA